MVLRSLEFDRENRKIDYPKNVEIEKIKPSQLNQKSTKVLKMVVDQIDLTGLSKSCADFAKVINSDQFRSVRANYEEKFNKYDYRAHLKKDEHLKSLIEQAEEKMRSKEFKICSKLYNEVNFRVDESEAQQKEIVLSFFRDA